MLLQTLLSISLYIFAKSSLKSTFFEYHSKIFHTSSTVPVFDSLLAFSPRVDVLCARVMFLYYTKQMCEGSASRELIHCSFVCCVSTVAVRHPGPITQAAMVGLVRLVHHVHHLMHDAIDVHGRCGTLNTYVTYVFNALSFSSPFANISADESLMTLTEENSGLTAVSFAVLLRAVPCKSLHFFVHCRAVVYSFWLLPISNWSLLCLAYWYVTQF